MLGMEADSLLERFLPYPYVLSGDAIEQIDGDILESRLSCRLYSSLRLPGPMASAQKSQKVVVEGLNADAYPVHSGLIENLHESDCRVSGICFDSDLRPLRNNEGPAGIRNQPFHLPGSKDGRGAPSYIESVEGLCPVLVIIHFPAKGSKVAFDQGAVGCGVKTAVRTLA